MDAANIDQLLEIRFSIASEWSAGPGRDLALRAVDDLLRGPAHEKLGGWLQASTRTD
jgi:hypothetical protein